MNGNAFRLIRLALWALVGAALLATLWFQVLSPRLNQEITAEIGIGDYKLETTDGSSFTAASLKGEPSAVFFGFTHCPDVCPTTLGDISIWQEDLAKDNATLRVFFISVDPERDTAQTLGDYVSWAPGVVGVTGTRAEVDKALKAFKIYARKVPGENGDYSMDHTAYVMLFDANGRFDQVITYQELPEKVLPKLRKLMNL
ncbi:SCO family protein [Gemmobacter serpentinus]|uniref:SCO family protein n=1 Tax=Gemmobacter serpentinus TaxID=2652247 RepID=UPI00124DEF97|nr:SCO family protein [Gemmobacter serpentinus]